jgi:UDP-N-acetylglucosamine pyrophosphorylase
MDYFGLTAGHFEFCAQAMLPAVDQNGKILMNSKFEVKLAPNGNGGLFEIIKRSAIRTYIE